MFVYFAIKVLHIFLIYFLLNNTYFIEIWVFDVPYFYQYVLKILFIYYQWNLLNVLSLRIGVFHQFWSFLRKKSLEILPLITLLYGFLECLFYTFCFVFKILLSCVSTFYFSFLYVSEVIYSDLSFKQILFRQINLFLIILIFFSRSGFWFVLRIYRKFYFIFIFIFCGISLHSIIYLNDQTIILYFLSGFNVSVREKAALRLIYIAKCVL